MNQSTMILTVSRIVLKGMLALTLIAVAAFALLLGATLFTKAELLVEFAAQPEITDPPRVLAGLRIAALLSIAAAAPAWIIFSRLLTIVETVSAGDPFVSANARRITAIAWALLAFQLLTTALTALKASYLADDGGLDWSALVTGWLAVLLLLVLAQVFNRGARMREELEGTV